MAKRIRTKRGECPPYVEVDRGFDGACWIGKRLVIHQKVAHVWFETTVGPKKPHELYQHTCEIRGERNYCLNPAHVVIGTKSTNAKHMHDLRAAAGEPWTGGRRRGEKMPPETGQKISRALKGRVFSDETRRRMSESQKRAAARRRGEAV